LALGFYCLSDRLKNQFFLLIVGQILPLCEIAKIKMSLNDSYCLQPHPSIQKHSLPAPSANSSLQQLKVSLYPLQKLQFIFALKIFALMDYSFAHKNAEAQSPAKQGTCQTVAGQDKRVLV
jgi:hypothetical protein